MSASQNLLPSSWCRRVLVAQRLRAWSLAWVVSALLAAFTCAGMLWAHRRNLTELSELQTAAAPLRQIDQQTSKLQQELLQLEGRESLLAMLDTSEQPFKIVGIVSQSAAQTAGKVQVREFSLRSGRKNATRASSARRQSLAQQATPVNTPTEQDGETVELRLVGVAGDDMAVTRFVDQLRQYNVFDTVTLHSSQSTSGDGAREFMISCEYEK